MIAQNGVDELKKHRFVLFNAELDPANHKAVQYIANKHRELIQDGVIAIVNNTNGYDTYLELVKRYNESFYEDIRSVLADKSVKTALDFVLATEHCMDNVRVSRFPLSRHSSIENFGVHLVQPPKLVLFLEDDIRVAKNFLKKAMDWALAGYGDLNDWSMLNFHMPYKHCAPYVKSMHHHVVWIDHFECLTFY